MILSLKIKNFLSFKDEVTFSFEATKDKSLEKYQVVEVAPGVRISKLGVVYGANASGKSNLVIAFDFLQVFWFNIPKSKDDLIDSTPFLLDNTSRDNLSEFELTFYIEGKKYIYSLKTTVEKVYSETLIYYPGIRPAEIFTRTLNDNISEIRLNPKLKVSAAAKEEIEVKCLTNMSVFAAYNKVNVQLAEMDVVISFIKKQLLRSVKPTTAIVDYVKALLFNDNSRKPYILDFLNKADFNITDVDIQAYKDVLSESVVADLKADYNIPDSFIDKIEKERFLQIQTAFFVHKVIDKEGKESLFMLPEGLQSSGTLRIMGLAGVLSRVINQNAFVAIDEIESSLHPKLIEFFIESFLKQSKTAQLLLTTHYDGLLEEEDLLRNDNIWFTNKRKDGSTELYSLSDFKGVNRITSLQKAYKYGKFGAIPNI